MVGGASLVIVCLLAREWQNYTNFSKFSNYSKFLVLEMSVSCYYSNLLQHVLSRAKLNFLSPKCVFQRQNYWVPLLQHFKSIWYVYMSQLESGRYCYTNSEPWCDYMISASYHKIIVIYISKIFGLEKLDYKTSS